MGKLVSPSWSERWSVSEGSASWRNARLTHGHQVGTWKISVEILFNPVCVCNDKRGEMLIFCMKNKNVGYGPICNGGEMVLSHKSFRIILLGILFARECIYMSHSQMLGKVEYGLPAKI